MGWHNAHMFKFSPKGYRSYPQIEIPYEEDPFFAPDGEVLDAEETKLSDIFIEEKQKFTYIYDFGDDWEHVITLEKMLPETTMFPQLLTGKGACPPEDCGGPWGYESMKEILEKDPGYKSYCEWLGLEKGEKWNPKLFNIEEANQLLLEVFSKAKK